jgi:hypothetical protein
MPSSSPEPHDVIKAPDPYAPSETISTSPDPCNISTGAPDHIGVLLPGPGDTWSPLARRGATRAPTMAPIPADGMDMTVHSEQEHGNRALI